MSDQTNTLGGRLPLADPTAMTTEQREVFDGLMTMVVPWANDVGFQSTTEDGRLIGPFNAPLLNAPVASALFGLQFAEVFHTSLTARVREVVILAVGAVWQSDYELYAHSAAARKAGISEDAVRVLVRGGLPPDDLSEKETIALKLARQLSTTHRIDEALYRQAEKSFGKKGLNDIATLIGIYHMVCTTLNMFAIPAPE